jgi:SAM-dependent methyltransferase
LLDFGEMAVPRRLVFGDVAELYDRSRPSYPEALVDDLIALSGVGEGRRALEVGAGTGKATVLFAARGVDVLAIEPSPGMAAVATRNCADFDGVEIVEADFERWDPAGERFGLLYSAQAWHWIDPELRYRRARAALAPGAVLAAFWHRAAWGASPLRDALSDVYRREAPGMDPDNPMHPDNLTPADEPGWPAEIAGADGFDAPGVRRYDWTCDYSGEEYAALLATLSEIRLLDEPTRDALLSGVRDAIEDHGGRLTMPMLTHVRLARAV